jgi:hypothetical protein
MSESKRLELHMRMRRPDIPARLTRFTVIDHYGQFKSSSEALPAASPESANQNSPISQAN